MVGIWDSSAPVESWSQGRTLESKTVPRAYRFKLGSYVFPPEGRCFDEHPIQASGNERNQKPSSTLAEILKRVLGQTRGEQRRTGLRKRALSVDFERDLPIDNVEQFVLALVRMEWWARHRWHSMEHARQPIVRVRACHLDEDFLPPNREGI